MSVAYLATARPFEPHPRDGRVSDVLAPIRTVVPRVFRHIVVATVRTLPAPPDVRAGVVYGDETGPATGTLVPIVGGGVGYSRGRVVMEG